MQIALTPSSAAEVRLLATFMQDYADLLEVQQVQPPVLNSAVAEGATPFVPVEAPPKKPRSKKETSATTAETPAASGSAETATAASVEGNAAAATPGASTEAPDGSTTTESAAGQSASAAEPMTHDKLRVLFGELTQRGDTVKQAIIAAFGKLGYANIKAIPVDELQQAHDVMVKAAG